MLIMSPDPSDPTRYLGAKQGGGKMITPEATPKLVSATPHDGAGAVSVNPVIRLNFDHPVSVGNGSLFISDGATQSFVNGAGQSDVRIVGASHTLQLSAGQLTVGGGGYYVEFTPPATLKPGTAYFVHFKDGVIVSAENGKPYPGVIDSTLLNFATSADATAPTALAARATSAAGVYNAGDIIHITVDFNEPVLVTGAPRLELNAGSGRFATLSGPAGGSSLAFSYTVQPGDTAAELALVDLASLAIGITDNSGNPLDPAHITFSALDAADGPGHGSDIVIDTTAPTVVGWNVTPGATDVPYGSNLSLTFNENIAITNATSRLFVAINGAAATPLALTDPAISISGNTLFFANLASNTQYVISLSAGALSDAGGNPVVGGPQIAFATAAPSPPQDSIAPAVLDVNASVGAAPTNLGVGAVLTLLVTMSENVTVNGTPKLQLSMGDRIVDAAYASVSGKIISFTYTVQAGDNSASLASAALVLNGGAITDIQGNAALLALPAPGSTHALDANTNITVDTAPLLAGAVPGAGALAVALGNNLLFTFSEALTLAGPAASIRLYRDDGGSSVELAVNASVTGKVVTLDPVANLELNKIYFVQIDSGALVDGNGNPFSGISGSTGYRFSTAQPDITAPMALGWSGASEGATDVVAAPVVLTFNENIVSASGTSTLLLSVNGAAATPLLLSDPRITIAGASLTLGGITPNTAYALSLNAGQVADSAGNLSVASSQLSFATAAATISGDSIAPRVLDVNATQGATATQLGMAQTVTLQVAMSEAVTVTGNPVLKLQLGASVVDALYTGTSGKVMSFSYTVGVGHNTPSLAYAGSAALTLNGAVINDLNGNPALLTLPAPGAPHSLDANTNIAVDTMPTLISASPAFGAAAVPIGANLSFTLSENVVLGGAPGAFRLYRDEAVDVQLPVTASVSGNVLTLDPLADLELGKNYYVQIDSTGVADSQGNAYAGIAGPTGFTFNTTVDMPPTASTARVTAVPGAYKAGAVIEIAVTFNETVTVTGTPRLELNSGSGRFATIANGASGSTLTFSYTVQPGDNAAALAFVDTGDLATGIIDAGGNPLDTGHISFSALDSFNFGGAGSGIVIDTSVPVAQTWNVAPGAINVSGAVTLTFNENIFSAGPAAHFVVEIIGGDGPEQVLLSDPRVTIANNTISSSAFLAGSTYQVTLAGGSLVDAAGNVLAAQAQVSFSTAPDTEAPTLIALSPVSGASNVAVASELVFTFSEDIIFAGSPSGIRLYANNGFGFEMRSVDVSIDGNVLKVDQTGDMVANADYYLVIETGVLTDASGNAFVGIAGAGGYVFNTLLLA